jgi:dienelactone hydrolase
MKKNTWLIFFLFSINIFGQNLKIINHQAIHFQVKNKKNIIDFIVADTVLNIKKPVFLFCQGSQPVPLFIKDEKGIFMIGGGVNNFDINTIRKKYHLVVISMPKTPLLVESKNLNRSYQYLPDPAKPDVFSLDFIKADFLENYVKRGQAVLQFLYRQKWVNKAQTLIAGHSQGTKVATKIALKNRQITHLGLFSPNPFGRIDQNVRQARKEAENQKITWEEADTQIENQYEFYKEVCNRDSVKVKPYLNAWKTFSEPLLSDWLALKIPVYLAYGTHDITSDLCDLVPLFFTQKHKENLTYKRYLHLEHNFFEKDEQGNTNYEKDHWKEVMNSFVIWTSGNR